MLRRIAIDIRTCNNGDSIAMKNLGKLGLAQIKRCKVPVPVREGTEVRRWIALETRREPAANEEKPMFVLGRPGTRF